MVVLGVLLLVAFTFLSDWLEFQTRTHKAQLYENVVSGQQRVLASLQNYFLVECNENGGFASGNVALSTVVNEGFLDLATIVRPHNVTYSLSITRPQQRFDATGTRVIADGSTLFHLAFSAQNGEEAALYKRAFDNKALAYNQSNLDFVFHQEYVPSAIEAQYQFLHGGGGGFHCR